MLETEKAFTLYHGSYCDVPQPDLSRCAKYKDFGRGFYLTTSHEQAASFAKLTTYRAITNGTISEKQSYGVVSVFHWTKEYNLDILEFPTADADWLHCVVGHRKRGSFPDVVESLRKFDGITGKIANDDTNATIIAYMADGICYMNIEEYLLGIGQKQY